MRKKKIRHLCCGVESQLGPSWRINSRLLVFSSCNASLTRIHYSISVYIPSYPTGHPDQKINTDSFAVIATKKNESMCHGFQAPFTVGIWEQVEEKLAA